MAGKKSTQTPEIHAQSIITERGPRGALTQRYHYNALEEILSIVHQRVPEGDELKDLRAYHFKGTRWMWHTEEGITNVELACGATGELITLLKVRNNWNDGEIIAHITQKHFHKEPIKFDATLGGMIDGIYHNSPSAAVIDYYQNHPDAQLQLEFKDLKPYHFAQAPRNTWTEKNGAKKYGLAREATRELVAILKKMRGWDDNQLKENIKTEDFETVQIKFGATLGGMLANVYSSSPKAAIEDYFANIAKNTREKVQ